MAKILELDLENEERLCALGSALSSPAPIQILKLLYHNSFNVAEIAEKLHLSEGSVKQYVKQIYSKLHIDGDTRTKRRRLNELLEAKA